MRSGCCDLGGGVQGGKGGVQGVCRGHFYRFWPSPDLVFQAGTNFATFSVRGRYLKYKSG